MLWNSLENVLTILASEKAIHVMLAIPAVLIWFVIFYFVYLWLSTHSKVVSMRQEPEGKAKNLKGVFRILHSLAKEYTEI